MTPSHCINGSHAPCNAGQYAMCRECHYNPRELSLAKVQLTLALVEGIKTAPAMTIALDDELRRGIIKLAAAGRKIEIIIREAR